MNRLVRALEEAAFGVANEFERRVGILRVQMLERAGGHDHRGGDVVLGLQFGRGMKVLAQPKHAPGAVGVVAHAQKIGNQLAPSHFNSLPGVPLMISTLKCSRQCAPRRLCRSA